MKRIVWPVLLVAAAVGLGGPAAGQGAPQSEASQGGITQDGVSRDRPAGSPADSPTNGLAAGQSSPPGASVPVQAPPAAEDVRYSFHRMGDGFIRLDTRTGQLANCSWSASGWACKLVPDERTALDGELSRLQRENAELKKALMSHGVELPPGVVAEAPLPRPSPPALIPDPSPRESKPPTEADLDRAFAFMKHVWRRLVEMMVDLQRDIQRKG